MHVCYGAEYGTEGERLLWAPPSPWTPPVACPACGGTEYGGECCEPSDA